jgi:tRNA threonylcarbamoyladenosine biosynthesis protein TsaB
MPTLLALDTSTERLVLGVQSPAGVWRLDEDGGPKASARIVPAVLELLARAGLRLTQLDAIAFGRGPGAFTGLRTACSVAQGLAFGAGRPVLAVDSLLVVADDARAQTACDELWVTMDARMGEVYAAAYRRQGERWQVVAAPALYELDALHEHWRVHGAPHCIAGSAIDAFGDKLAAGAALQVPMPRDRAGALLRVATMLWHDGAAVDAAQALPLYLRDKVALTTAERAEIVR